MNKDSKYSEIRKKLNKGGEGSGKRGHVSTKPEISSRIGLLGEESDNKNKLQAHLEALKSSKVLPGKQTSSGKPLVLDMEDSRKEGYTVNDHNDAINIHFEIIEKISKSLDKLKILGKKIPIEAKEIVDLHSKKMKDHMSTRDRLINRNKKTEEAIKEKRRNIKKSIVNAEEGHGGRDINLGPYSEVKQNANAEWVEKIFKTMENYSYGDVPRELNLDTGTIYLSKVDDGLYSGYMVKKENTKEGILEDTSKIRIERITIPELVSLCEAKEWITPRHDSPEKFRKEESSPIESLNEKLQEPDHINKKIKILELIDKLLSR